MRSLGSAAEMNVGVEGEGVSVDFCRAIVGVEKIVGVALETIGVATIGTRVALAPENGAYPQPDRKNTNEKILVR
jgi:hypothetical protein